MNDLFEDLVELLAKKVYEKIKEEQELPEKKEVERTKLKGIREIAKFLGVAISTAQRLNADGKIPTYRAGKRVYTYTDELEASIKKGGSL